MNNSAGRYSYWRVRHNGYVLLLRDDGYRMHLLHERSAAGEQAQEEGGEWTLLFEYKYCNWPWLANAVIQKCHEGFEPAPIDTIPMKFLVD